MDHLFIFLLLINISSNLFGQNTTQPTTQVFIKTAPLSFIDVFGNTAALVSIETKLQNKISISLDAGVLYHSLGYGLQNNRGWRTGIELRYYLKNKQNYYIGTSYTFKDQQYDFEETITIDGLNPYKKNNAYSKKVSTINLLYGIQSIQINKRFFINYFGGFGIRFKNTSTMGLTSTEIKNRGFGDSTVLTSMNETGTNLRPNIVLGFKLGWQL